MHKISKVAAMATLVSATFLTTGCDFVHKLGIFRDSGKIEAEYILPTDRENIQGNTSSKTYSPEELNKGIVKGDWAIETVDGKPAVGQKAPYLKFVPGEKRVYGNNGCNTINSNYTYNPADSTISFSNTISTMMACDKEGITDIEINLALDRTRYYTWKLDGSQFHLFFYDENHREVMSLMHQDFNFLNGAWHVTAINGEKVNVEGMDIVFDVDEGKVHGETGCNLFNGTFETDRETANSISFHAIAMTRMACPDARWETPLVVALEDAAYARPVSSTSVRFLDDNNKVVLQLERKNVSITK